MFSTGPSIASQSRPAGVLGWRETALLVVFCLFAFVPGIASLPPHDRDEARFVQASKQMVESGDYVDIRFQDSPRYKKPVGIYWLQAAAVIASGQGSGAPIWVYRSVSVIAGTVAVLAMAWLAVALFGSSAGLIAGIALGGLLDVGLESRIAKTDATLLAVSLLAQGALARLYVAHRNGEKAPSFLPWLFWAMQGIGILVKAPVLVGLSCITIAALVIADRDRSWLKSLRPAGGIMLMLLIAAPWLLLITWKSGAEFWQASLGRDFFGKVQSVQESHGFPPGYYFLLGSFLLWPFGAAAVRAGVAGLTRIRQDARLRFLCAWYVPWWLALEIMPTKLPHYMLPAYPALIAAIAWAITDPAARSIVISGWKLWLHRAAMFGTVLVTLGLAVFAAGVVPYVVGDVYVPGIVAAILFLVAGWFGLGKLSRSRVLTAGIAGSAALGMLAALVLPALTTVWISPQLAEAFQKVKPCPQSRLVSLGYGEPSLVFLAGTNTLTADKVNQAAAAVAGDLACTVAAVDAPEVDEFLAALGPLRERVEPVATVGGLNYSKGQMSNFTLYRARQ